LPTGSRSAVTLIEILAGLVILATLLVSAAMARGRFLRQCAEADEKLRLAEAADHMLAQWSLNLGAVRVPSEGSVPAMRGFRWKASRVHDLSAERLSAEIVHVDFFREGDRKRLFSVDLLRHVYPKPMPIAPPPAAATPGRIAP
jgi:hypothetical protein